MERLEEERATCNDLRTQLEVTARQQTDVLMDIQRDVQRMRDSMCGPSPTALWVSVRPHSAPALPC